MTARGSRSSRFWPGDLVPIHSDSPTRNLTGAAIMLLTALGQIVGLVRYVRRLPDDVLGIGLYLFTAGWLLLMAILLFRRSRQLRDGLN